MPRVTMHMETVGSYEDFEQPLPLQVAFALQDRLICVLQIERGRCKLRQNGTREANTSMVGTGTKVGENIIVATSATQEGGWGCEC